MFRILLISILALILVSCGGSGDDGRDVSKSDYGDDWPLTRSSATLHCKKLDAKITMVWVEVGNSAYALNGTAMTWLENKRPDLNVRDLKQVWRDDPAMPGFKVSVGPLIDDGLDMCESG